MEIIVYGLGKRGEDFIQAVQRGSEKVKIVAITDTYVKGTSLQLKSEISYIEPICIRNYHFDYVVVTPEEFYTEIRESLIKMGIDGQKIKFRQEIEELVGEFYCNLCKSMLLAWRITGNDYEVFHTKKIIGASKRWGRCPKCGSIDRWRYVYYIVKQYTKLLDGMPHSVLHFAPENMLGEKLKNTCGEGYISADIMADRAEVIADITKLQFKDEQFDYVICNHVMEHVSAEKDAFSEVRRCLKVGGVLIFSSPICWEQETYEDNRIVTEKDRIKYYGQENHVRLYGNDIVERIEAYGYEVRLYRCNELMDERMIKKYGFISEDSVLLCKKSSKTLG